jgi:O-antigen ligase
MAAYAFAAPTLFIPGLVDLYVLPRTSLALLFGGGLSALAAIRSANRPATEPGGVGSLGWLALLVAGASLVAALVSINPWLSMVGAYTRYESVGVRLAYVGLGLAGAVLLAGADRRRARRLVAAAFVLGCTVAAAEAAWQLATHSLARPDGNLGQANLLGALLAMAIPVSLQVGFRSWPALATLPVLCFGLFASSSRSGWLAALVGCLVVLVTVLPARNRRLGAAIACLVLAGAAAAILLSPLRNLNSDTGSARLGVWRDGVSVVAARPVTGWGEEATGLVFGRFQTQNWEPGNTFDRIHDQPLDLLATQGLLGLLACAAFWSMIWWRSIRAVAAGRGGATELGLGSMMGALAAYTAWSLLNFDWAPATGPFWLLGGVAWAEARSRTPSLERPAGQGARRRLPRPLMLAFGVVVSIAGVFLAAAPIAADRAYFTGDDRRAVALDPLQAQYHRVLGEALGHTPAGLTELERARDLGEYDYQFFIELGDVARELGHPAEARAAYERAEQIDRYDPTSRGRLAILGTP